MNLPPPPRPGERMRRPGLTGLKVRMLRTTILHSWIKVAGAAEGQPILDDVDRLQLHGTIYRPDSFVLMLRYFANLKAIRYESTSSKESQTINRIVAIAFVSFFFIRTMGLEATFFCNLTPEDNRGDVIYSTFHFYKHEHLLQVNFDIYQKLLYYVQ